MPDSQAATSLAAAKLTRGLLAVERRHLVVEGRSVYGAAILMPQVARSSNWNREFSSLMVSSYVYLFFCICLHGCLLTFIAKEEKVMDAFGGQMSLCDFGAHMANCKDNEEACLGPGGTKMTPPRLYNWGQWTTRVFVRNALQGIFPEKKEEIETYADPGEYGLEAYYCRILCVTIFFTSIISEIWLCIDMAKLLWYTPNLAEPWVELLDDADEISAHTPEQQMKQVRVKVAGMPLVWKMINAVLVLLPKSCLVYLTGSAGTTFLMESAGIDDMIINSVALGFLLEMDTLITENLMSDGANHLLEMCEGLPNDSRDQQEQFYEALSATETLETFTNRDKERHFFVGLMYDVFFVQLWKFFAVFCISGAFIVQYYWTHCQYVGGQFVSKSMYTPKTMDYNFLNAFFGSLFPIQEEKDPYWTMPHSN